MIETEKDVSQNPEKKNPIIRRLQTHNIWLASITIILTNLFALGRFTPYLGIYYDEFVTFYVLERFGMDKLLDLAGGQARELAAFVISLASQNYIFGHILMFSISTGCALLIMWIIRRMFPDAPYIGTLAGMLYLTYPVYFMRVYLTSLSIEGSVLVTLLSFVLMYQAIRQSGWLRAVLLILSLVAIPAYINLYEMSIVLEVLRPFIVLVALRDSGRTGNYIQSTALWSLIWVIGGGAAIYYRLFIFEPYGFYASINYNTGISVSSGINGILVQIIIAIQGLRSVLIGPWVAVFRYRQVIFDSPSDLISALSIAIVGFGVVFASRREKRSRVTVVSAVILIFAGIGFPVLSHFVIMLVGRNLSGNAFFYSYLSRIYITSYMGVILLIIGILWLINNFLKGIAGRILTGGMIAIVLFVGSITHMHWHEAHVESWKDSTDFLWQLAEIAPDLDDGTTIIVDTNIALVDLNYIPFFMGDLFYENSSIVLVEASSVSPEGVVSMTIDNGDWSISWRTDYSNAILAYLDESECVQILDPGQDDIEALNLSEQARSILHLLPSDPSQYILSTPIEDTTLRDRYFPRPAQLRCERDMGDS